MDAFSRTITIHCPDCGGTGFALLDCSSQEEITTAPYDSRLQCLGCQRVFTKGELIQCQQEAIEQARQSIEEEMDGVMYSTLGEELEQINNKLIDLATDLGISEDFSEEDKNN